MELIGFGGSADLGIGEVKLMASDLGSRVSTTAAVAEGAW